MSVETNPWSAPPSSLTHLSQLHPIEDTNVDNENSRRATSSMSLTPPAPPSAQPPSLPRHQFITARRDPPPHEYRRTPARESPDGRPRTYVPPQLRGPHSHQRAQRHHEQDSESSPSSRESMPSPPPRRAARGSRHHRSHRAPTITQRVTIPVASATALHAGVIRRETLAGLPPWPSELKLSLSAGNWLEWSRCLLRALAMSQLDEYPLGLLPCPNEHAEPLGHRCWNGNDRMILGYMQSHMYSAEVLHITTCATSAEAFRLLRARHEKRSGMTQLQLIQKLMGITFDDDPAKFEAAMTTYRDLIYRIESIGHVDIHRLGLLFLLLNVKTSHPAVHDGLTPALVDGTITVELLEARMLHHFEMRSAELTHVYGSAPSPSLAFPAYMPPRITLCPNCKRTGHTIEFCVAPGGKMEGLSTFEAITRQRAARESSRQRGRLSGEPTQGPGNAQGPSSTLRIDDDGCLWIGGVRYRPDHKISAAIAATPEPSADAPDQGEFPDWAPANFADTPLDTDTMLIASVEHETALLSHPSDIPFFLDSGASSHISCLSTDFSAVTQLSVPRKISGVGNAAVYAVGIGTIDILLPETNVRLQLQDVLFAPEANVRLVSIHQLNRLGYTTVFRSGHCQLTSKDGMVIADCTPGPSNLYALPNAFIQTADNPTNTSIALPSLHVVPDLETWHRRLGHANHRTVLDMARNGTAAGAQPRTEGAGGNASDEKDGARLC